MGGCQFDGAEREHSDGHGRADCLRCDRHISAQHSQFENRMIETSSSLGLRSFLLGYDYPSLAIIPLMYYIENTPSSTTHAQPSQLTPPHPTNPTTNNP